MNMQTGHLIRDNGGRRLLVDRRHQPAIAFGKERRSNWKRRSGMDRRQRKEFAFGPERRDIPPIVA